MCLKKLRKPSPKQSSKLTVTDRIRIERCHLRCHKRHFAGSRHLTLAGMVWFAAAHTLFFVVLAVLYARLQGGHTSCLSEVRYASGSLKVR